MKNLETWVSIHNDSMTKHEMSDLYKKSKKLFKTYLPLKEHLGYLKSPHQFRKQIRPDKLVIRFKIPLTRRFRLDTDIKKQRQIVEENRMVIERLTKSSYHEVVITNLWTP